MLKVKDEYFDLLYNRGVSNKKRVELHKIDANEKISIMSDAMFKTMFYNENRLKYSCRLLSYFLNVSYDDLLKHLRLSKSEVDKDNNNEKNQRCDYVADIFGTSINIEVNMNDKVQTLRRNMHYSHRLFSKKVKSSSDEKDYEYTQVVQVNINNFSFKGNDKIVDIYVPRNNEGLVLDDSIIFIQIYVPNLLEKWYTNGIGSLSEAERFILVLVESNLDKSTTLGGEFDFMKDYIDDAKVASRDEDLLESYDKEWALKDQALRDGFAEGMEQGVKQGIEQRDKEIIINMYNDKVDIKTIAKYTKLSKEEINKIINNK